MRDVENRSEYTYWKRPWQKWALLIAAVLESWILWSELQEYRSLSQAGIFSDALWADYTSQKMLQCSINVVLILLFFGVFLIGILSRTKKAARLAEGFLLLFIALAWGAAGLLLHLLSSGSAMTFWLILLFALLLGAANCFWQYHRE